MPRTKFNSIPAHPVKSFFVDMLTRDIDLKDAMLDLLDNCVDGIQRIETATKLKQKKPYAGHWAKITFSKDSFAIEDNCGGIPWKFHDYAFRMGRIKDKNIDKGRKTVGVYGIGMKRAIFKMGRDCTITSHAADASYKVRISPEWMQDESDWDIDVSGVTASKTKGTKINVSKLNAGIAKDFDSANFENEFCAEISTHYAYIMEKGFSVFVNEKQVQPQSLHLLFSRSIQHTIQPFIYETQYKGVDVFLAVGFTGPIPGSDEVNDAMDNYKD